MFLVSSKSPGGGRTPRRGERCHSAEVDSPDNIFPVSGSNFIFLSFQSVSLHRQVNTTTEPVSRLLCCSCRPKGWAPSRGEWQTTAPSTGRETPGSVNLPVSRLNEKQRPRLICPTVGPIFSDTAVIISKFILPGKAANSGNKRKTLAVLD